MATTISINNYMDHLSELTFADYCRLISISKGNRKTGAIRSLSTPPYITCDPGLHCYKACYAARMKNYAPSTITAWTRNLELYKNNPQMYWDAVEYLTVTDACFRYSVGGDIVDNYYFERMCTTAETNVQCDYLVFTKKYGLVNKVLDYREQPDNLQILFSVDFEQAEPDNPHKLPLVHVVDSLEDIPEDWIVCGGNCTECRCRNTGCWTLKAGQHLAILKH